MLHLCDRVRASRLCCSPALRLRSRRALFASSHCLHMLHLCGRLHASRLCCSPAHMMGARLAWVLAALRKGHRRIILHRASLDFWNRLQALGAASSAPRDAESEQAQQLAALQEEQGSLKRQLVGLQQAEAGHLKTISEVRF